MNDFEALNAVARGSGAIGSANLGTNLIELRKTKPGWQVTVGLDHKWGERLYVGDVVGALYVADEAEFFRLRKEPSPRELDLISVQSIAYKLGLPAEVEGETIPECVSRILGEMSRKANP